MKTILVLEDDPAISEIIRLNLEYAGFAVIQAETGAATESLISKHRIALLVLDLMLPDCVGFSLMPLLKKREIPVIIVSARDRLADKITGLDLGADDYLTKPFDAVELIARIKAILRRTQKTEPEIRLGEILINLATEQVFIKDSPVDLSLKEYQLLICLAENRGMIFSRDRLLEKIWGYSSNCDTRTVDMHITRLRAKLKADIIKTVYKRGYRIER